MKNRKNTHFKLRLRALLIWGSLFVAGCSSEQAGVVEAPNARPVDTFTVEHFANTHTSSFLGRVRAPKELNLAFELAGKVDWIATTTGQRFAAGEKLGMLDGRRYQLAFDDATQRLAFANKELERMEKLLEGGSSTVAEFDRVQNSASLARIAWERSKQDLEDCVLYAPFGGKLAAKKVEIGSFVAPGQAVMVFQETGATEVDFYQTESQLMTLVSGLGEGSLLLKLDGEGVNEAELRLKDYATTPDAHTGSYRTTLVVVAKEYDMLLPGVPVRISVTETLANRGESPVEIPANALVSLPDGQFQVWVYDEGAERLEARAVETGRIGGKSVEILDGLGLGDRVVTSGSSLIRANTLVSAKLNF